MLDGLLTALADMPQTLPTDTARGMEPPATAGREIQNSFRPKKIRLLYLRHSTKIRCAITRAVNAVPQRFLRPLWIAVCQSIGVASPAAPIARSLTQGGAGSAVPDARSNPEHGTFRRR
jgi:LSD1 subclass zinc finger protein